MNILAIDTALAACSVAVLADGRAVARSVAMARGHAEALMPMLGEALAEAGLAYAGIDRFVVTVGPGTFTGVRVGVAAVRGLALATGKPAVGITTLEALAKTARLRHPDHAGPLLIAMDARRQEVYAQVFAANNVPTGEPAAVAAADLAGLVPSGVATVFGSGAEIAASAFAASGRNLAVLGTDPAPDPVAVAILGRDRPAGAPPKPLYLRPPDAKPQAGARLART